jgi:hypothetical protein
VKQLEDEIIHPELRERGNRRVAEAAIGFSCEAGEVMLRNGVSDERSDDVGRDFRVGPPSKAGDRLDIEPRPSRGDIQAAVAGKSCQRDLDKAKRRGLTSGGDIEHEPAAPNEAMLPSRRALFAPPSDHITC